MKTPYRISKENLGLPPSLPPDAVSIQNEAIREIVAGKSDGSSLKEALNNLFRQRKLDRSGRQIVKGGLPVVDTPVIETPDKTEHTVSFSPRKRVIKLE